MEDQKGRCRGVGLAVRGIATELRRNETPAEQLLWSALRRKRVHGVKFRHQHAIGRFVLDFYTVEFKLAIELDGDVHVDRADYDRDRTEYLNALGIRVIRFANDEVLSDLDRVTNQITAACTHAPLT